MRHQKRQAGRLALPFLAVLLFLAGAAIFLYPTVSNYFAEKAQASAIRTYQNQVESGNPEDLAAEWEKAEIYNESLSGDPVRDPFIAGSGYALPDNYLEVLNIDGVMGYLEIPKISVSLPIYHGTSDEVLEKGVGHIESTALPIGGDYRHTVLTGHRGLPSAELFTRLDELEEGDQFYIHVLGEILAYEVDQIKTVLPTEVDEILPIPGRDLATLITCTPYGVNTHRLLVRGSRTEYIPPKEDHGGEAGESGPDFQLSRPGIALGGLLLAAMLLFLAVRRLREGKDRRRRQRRETSGKRRSSGERSRNERSGRDRAGRNSGPGRPGRKQHGRKRGTKHERT